MLVTDPWSSRARGMLWLANQASHQKSEVGAGSWDKGLRLPSECLESGGSGSSTPGYPPLTCPSRSCLICWGSCPLLTPPTPTPLPRRLLPGQIPDSGRSWFSTLRQAQPGTRPQTGLGWPLPVMTVSKHLPLLQHLHLMRGRVSG